MMDAVVHFHGLIWLWAYGHFAGTIPRHRTLHIGNRRDDRPVVCISLNKFAIEMFFKAVSCEIRVLNKSEETSDSEFYTSRVVKGKNLR